MIKTDLPVFQKDFEEEISMFNGASDLTIRHLFSDKGERVSNTIVIDGKKSYAFGNLMPKCKDEIERKRFLKRFSKLAIYKALSTYLNQTFPWGSLTGIRPTKLAYQEIERAHEFKDFFVDTMKVSEEKTVLTEEVLNTQKGIYEINDDNTDLFVFIPFCPSRCRYCSFICTDIKSSEKYVKEYIDTLIKEIDESAKYIKKLRSIYIGGGTPVSIPVDELERLLECIDKYNVGVEYTVEAGRPDVIDREKLALLKKYRVTRICVNPQTFNDKTLKLIGRNHTGQDVVDKYYLAKDDFIINMDLIAGLDGETFEDFKYSLDKAISLSPDNITVHTLCIKKGSELARQEERLSGEEIEKMVNYSYKVLKEKGYMPYYLYRQKYMAGNLENVGYTKEGKACVYNIDTMEEIASTVACGANAISKRVFNGGERIERSAPPKDVKTYLDSYNKIMEEKNKLFS